MKKMKDKISVSYEGMGTCVEAYFKINGVTAFTIGSHSAEMNVITISIIESVEALLIKNATKPKKKAKP